MALVSFIFLCVCSCVCSCQCAWLSLQFTPPPLAQISLLVTPRDHLRQFKTNNGSHRPSMCPPASFPSPPLTGLSSWCLFHTSHTAILLILSWSCVIQRVGAHYLAITPQALAPPSTMASRFMTIKLTNRVSVQASFAAQDP